MTDQTIHPAILEAIDVGAAVERFRCLIQNVKFKDYGLNVNVSDRGEIYMVGHYFEPDVYSGETEMQKTRRWILSPHATNSELVQTAFKLCLTSFEHRAREAFTYKGARVFGPHFDVEDLVGLCKSGKEDAGGRKPRGLG